MAAGLEAIKEKGLEICWPCYFPDDAWSSTDRRLTLARSMAEWFSREGSRFVEKAHFHSKH